jgi:hypothetical protein
MLATVAFTNIFVNEGPLEAHDQGHDGHCANPLATRAGCIELFLISWGPDIRALGYRILLAFEITVTERG